MYRVLIVDAHQMLRRGIRAILEDRFAAIAVIEACNVAEADTALDASLDAILLDLGLPGRNGFESLEEIRARVPAVPVLIVSIHGEAQFAVRAVRAGASGYLTKAAAPEELITAFDRVVHGNRYITASLAARLLNSDQSAPHDSLSNREFEVMRGIASGQSVGEIAAWMGLSVKTVSTYRARLLDKMQMESNADLTRYALHNGLV